MMNARVWDSRSENKPDGVKAKAGAHLGRWALVVGDLLVLLTFAYIGQREHETVSEVRPLLGVLWTGLPFALAWFAAGWWLGAFAEPGVGTRPFLARSLNTWLVAAPLGVLLRSYLLERAVIPTVFVTAALGFGGAMVLGWRVIFLLLSRIRRKT